MRVFIDAVGITSSGGATVLWNLMDQLPRAAPEIDWRGCTRCTPTASRGAQTMRCASRMTTLVTTCEKAI